MNAIAQSPVTISNAASAEIINIMRNKNIPEGYGLRVGVRGGGCGIQLMLGFDKAKQTDLVYTENGIPVIVDKKHMMFLIGKEIEFHNGADARGFHFIDAANRQSNPD